MPLHSCKNCGGVLFQTLSQEVLAQFSTVEDIAELGRSLEANAAQSKASKLASKFEELRDKVQVSRFGGFLSQHHLDKLRYNSKSKRLFVNYSMVHII